MSKVTELQEWMIDHEKDMPSKVFHLIMGQLQSIAKDDKNMEASWLPDDLVDTVNKYKIPQTLYGDKISQLQEFNLNYTPNELPVLTVKYAVINNDDKDKK